MNPSNCRSLAHLLRLRAEREPDRLAFAFLPDGENIGPQITYSRLDQQARGIARRLRSIAGGGERAVLLYPPGVDFIAAFFGCLYAGVIAVPTQAPHPARIAITLPRLQAIARDARAAVVLAHSEIANLAALLCQQCPELGRAQWLSTDDVRDQISAGDGEIGCESGALAFLQYTSGSTAQPKGVMVTHGNLLHNLACIEHCQANDPASVSVSWLPPFHDLGLIGAILQPVYSGYPGYLMSPAAFLQKPVRWLQTISRFRGTNSGGPNFAFDLCVRRTTRSQREELDLRSWRYAYNGAEPVRLNTLNEFAEVFAVAGFQKNAFRPVYGLAEGTLAVTAGGQDYTTRAKSLDPLALTQGNIAEVSAAASKQARVIACGPPCPGVDLAIVDPTQRVPCAPNAVGEIWVASPSVAQGYWNRPEETEPIFRASIRGRLGRNFLRTGDLGFFSEGELFVVGRLKDLIIIRGRKHHPQDIELTVEQSHPLVRANGSVAFSVTLEAGEQLVILVEMEPRAARGRNPHQGASLRTVFETEELFSAIRGAVSENHSLQAHTIVLLAPGAISRTTSGKLQRSLCRERFQKNEFEPIASWSQSNRSEPFVAPDAAYELNQNHAAAGARQSLNHRTPTSDRRSNSGCRCPHP